MKTLFTLLSVVFLLCAGRTQCQAMISVEDVSQARARELGVTFRTHTNGQAGMQVWMEFKLKGELQKITYVELQVGDGPERIASAHLRVSNPDPASASVNFSAFPAYLSKSTLMIVVYNGPRGDVGYQFKVKDFIEPEKRQKD
jgi:hypothetical protein